MAVEDVTFYILHTEAAQIPCDLITEEYKYDGRMKSSEIVKL